MISDHWRWRLGAALLGTPGYWLLYRPDWRNPFIALYDIPTLLLAFSFAGAVIHRLGVARTPANWAHPGVMLAAVVLACGAQYRAWPVSGHLTVALTAGIIETGDPLNPAWLRGCALVPAVLLVLIRTCWPQTTWMGNAANTAAALAVGGLLGVGGRLAGRRWN